MEMVLVTLRLIILYQPTNVQPEEYFKKYDDTLRKLVNDVEKLKGEMGNVRPITNAGSANGGSSKKQS